MFFDDVNSSLDDEVDDETDDWSDDIEKLDDE